MTAEDLYVRQTLGEILAEQRALRGEVARNHGDAGKQWEILHAELRNVKHAQHNLEQANQGHFHAFKRVEDKLRLLSSVPQSLTEIDNRLEHVEVSAEQTAELEKRIGKMEKLASRIGWISSLASTCATALIGFIVWAVAPYARYLLNWFLGKPHG